MVYAVFFFFLFFGRRFVGDQTQTSLGQTSNDATYDVYSSKAFCVTEALDSKQVLNI